MRRASGFAAFILAAVTIIPAAFALTAYVGGASNACLLAVAEDRPGLFCQLGIRLRYRP
jgi:hypothetical protein